MERLRLSLFELNSIVSEIISMSLPDRYWVEAELSEAREGYGGHCYLELIQKDERSNTPIAKAHAIMTTTFITGAILALPLIIGFVGIALFSAKKQKNIYKK